MDDFSHSGETMKRHRSIVMSGESVVANAYLFITLAARGLNHQSFGISFSTTLSMVKLAALARGGNSLKLSSHFMRYGGAAY